MLVYMHMIHTCMCVYVCMCVYIHIYIENTVFKGYWALWETGQKAGGDRCTAMPGVHTKSLEPWRRWTDLGFRV